MIGRAEYVDLDRGLSSTYSCNNCCPDSFDSAGLDPRDVIIFIDGAATFIARQSDRNCYGTLFGPFIVAQSVVTWDSTNGSIASVSSGQATGHAAGSCFIEAEWPAPDWSEDGFGECEAATVYADCSADMEVEEPTVTLTVGHTTRNLMQKTNIQISVESETTPSAYEIQIRRSGSGSWETLSDLQSANNFILRVAGNLQFRGRAEVSGVTYNSNVSNLEVRFPFCGAISGNATVKSFTDATWQQTLDAASPTGIRELGYWITLDTSTGQYDHTSLIQGDLFDPDAPVVIINLGAKPADMPADPDPRDDAVYVVACFHTHPPNFYSNEGRNTGPSNGDSDAANADQVVGIVYDYSNGFIPANYPLDSPATRKCTGPSQRPTP